MNLVMFIIGSVVGLILFNIIVNLLMNKKKKRKSTIKLKCSSCGAWSDGADIKNVTYFTDEPFAITECGICDHTTKWFIDAPVWIHVKDEK